MQNASKIQLFRTIAALFCGAAVLCWAAVYNGFPLVYSDTGTYLESGFTLETPLDRPIMYGVFLRVFSFNGLSIWPVIFVQSLALTTVLFSIVAEFTSASKIIRTSLVVVIILAAVTGLPWVASELIADIFTPICMLTVPILLFGKQQSRGRIILLYLILLIATACHISNVLINVATLIAVVLFIPLLRWRGKNLFVRKKSLVLILAISGISFLTMSSAISKSRHVFMMGRLLESGILDAYLDEHCSTDSLLLCKYRGRLPHNAETFIWNSDGDSVLLLTGGWLGSKPEYSEIISETFSEPRYLLMHIKSALRATTKQLTAIHIGEGLGVYSESELVSVRLKKYFPNEYEQYSSSRQSHNEFAGMGKLDYINLGATLLSLAIVLIWVVFGKTFSNRKLLMTFTLIMIWGYLINCAICASLAVVAHRFGARISWIAILLALLIVIQWINNGRFFKPRSASVQNNQ